MPVPNIDPYRNPHSFGDEVSVDEVIWVYVRHDFALEEARGRLDLARPDPDRYDERVAALREKPWRPDARQLTWRYEHVPVELLRGVRTAWRGPSPGQPPSVPDVVRRMRREDRGVLAEELGVSVGSFDKIERLAGDDRCGVGPEYQTMILFRGASGVSVLEGGHRLCAAWLRFSDRPDSWPRSLGAFVGQRR